jgi:metal-sulfur cluster biosynthetic enzyme
MSAKIKKNLVIDKLNEVIDPELHMSIIDIGLVYNVNVEKDKVDILMTLTSLGCPLFDTIQEDIYAAITQLGFKKEHIKINLTFEPPWSMDRMTERGKAMLGI